jgi:hypothetical protein
MFVVLELMAWEKYLGMAWEVGGVYRLYKVAFIIHRWAVQTVITGPLLYQEHGWFLSHLFRCFQLKILIIQRRFVATTRSLQISLPRLMTYLMRTSTRNCMSYFVPQGNDFAHCVFYATVKHIGNFINKMLHVNCCLV